MASMNLDPSTALAEKYKGNRQVLQSAVLGQSTEGNIDPYSALRALQKLNVADRYEMMQKAMAGQPNPPSIAQQTVLAAQSAGLPAMPVPEETFGMAGGGLVAFAAGGSEFPVEPSASSIEYGKAYRRGYEQELDPEAYYSKRAKDIEEMQAMGPEDLEQEKGLAALQAAMALSQGSDPIRGLGAAGAAFGEHYGAALRAAKKEKRSLMQMQAELEDARRKEQAGLYKDQRAAEDRALAQEQAAYNARWEREKFAETAQLDREKTAATMAAAQSKDPKWQNAAIAAFQDAEYVKWMRANPDKKMTAADKAELDAAAVERFQQNQREIDPTKLQQSAAQLNINAQAALDKHMKEYAIQNAPRFMTMPPAAMQAELEAEKAAFLGAVKLSDTAAPNEAPKQRSFSHLYE